MTEVVGIDIGGTKCLARLEDAYGNCIRQIRKSTGRNTGPQKLVDLIGTVLQELHDPGHDVKALGVGFPGLVDSRNGVVLSSVILDGWENFNLQESLESQFRLPVRIANDVKNALRGEMYTRTGVEKECILMLSMGTGISGGIAINGKLLEGASGLAGELGHISLSPDGPVCHCGRNGCLGMQCGGEAIEARLGLGLGELMSQDMNREPVKAILIQAANRIGWVLGSVMNILNPSLVVFSGGLAKLGPRFLGPIEARAREECFREISAACRFETASLDYAAGAIGSAVLARELLAESL